MDTDYEYIQNDSAVKTIHRRKYQYLQLAKEMREVDKKQKAENEKRKTGGNENGN